MVNGLGRGYCDFHSSHMADYTYEPIHVALETACSRAFFSCWHISIVKTLETSPSSRLERHRYTRPLIGRTIMHDSVLVSSSWNTIVVPSVLGMIFLTACVLAVWALLEHNVYDRRQVYQDASADPYAIRVHLHRKDVLHM